jgi:hypothetical protein
LAYDKRLGLLDIIVQHSLTFDKRIKFSLKNQFCDFLSWAECGWIKDARSIWYRNCELGFMKYGGSDVPSMLLVCGSNIFSLFVVAAVEDLVL